MEDPSENNKGIIKRSGVVSILTLFSRILGLIRDMLMAKYFGRGWEAGAFFLVWTLPNLFRRLLGEGALSAAFIPIYVKEKEKGKNLLSKVLGALSILLIFIVLFGFITVFVVPDSVFYLAFSRSGVPVSQYVGLLKKLFFILFPYLIPICILGIITGVLQAERIFWNPGFAPVLQNILWIGALLFGGLFYFKKLDNFAVFIALILLIGGILQILIQLPPLKRKNLIVKPKFEPKDPDIKEVATYFLPAVFGLAVYQINVFFDQVIAATLVPEPGANALLYYANRLFQFPLALISTAASTASYPEWSKLFAKKKTNEVRDSFLYGTRRVIFLAIPSAIGIMVISLPLVALLFVRSSGTFSLNDAKKTSEILVFLAPALPFVSFSQMATRIFQAGKEFKIPVKVGFKLVFVNLFLNLLLVWPFGVSGLAIATTLTAILRSIYLAILLKRIGIKSIISDILNPLPKFLIASLMMGIIVYTITQIFKSDIIKIVLSIPLGICIFFFVCYFIKIKEMDIIKVFVKTKRNS